MHRLRGISLTFRQQQNATFWDPPDPGACLYLAPNGSLPMPSYHRKKVRR